MVTVTVALYVPANAVVGTGIENGLAVSGTLVRSAKVCASAAASKSIVIVLGEPVTVYIRLTDAVPAHTGAIGVVAIVGSGLIVIVTGILADTHPVRLLVTINVAL